MDGRGEPSRSSRDRSQPRIHELRVETDTDWVGGMPSPRRVATAPTSPSTAYSTDREAVFRSGNATVAETHMIRSSGSSSNSFTEEHWSSEIKSFIATAPPKFIQVIKAYRVLSSDQPTLVVEVASDPPAIFEWFCNDRPVMQDRRRFQARHGLNITTLTVSQPEQGVYKCTARNPAGVSTSYGYITVNFENLYSEWTEKKEKSVEEELATRTTVTVHTAPRFVHQVPNLTIQPGSEAILDVEVDANPPARFAWFVNGQEYRETVNSVHIFYPSPNRVVARFSLPVAGEYKCVASNVHGSAMSAGFIEIHQANPQKQMRPPVAPGEHIARNMMSSSHYQQGSSSAERKQQEKVITHESTSIYEVNYSQRSSSVPRGVRHLEKHVEVAHDSSLNRHRAEEIYRAGQQPRPLHKTRSDGGRYLPHPPRFITQLPSEIIVQPNEKLVLSVDVAAIPTAHFKWNVNGFEVKQSKQITLLNEQNRSTLVVQPPVKQGKYNVTASNDAGRDSLTTKITHTMTEVTEEIQTETRIEEHREPSNPPDILETAVTVTSAQDDWEMMDDAASNPSTTSLETVRNTISEKVEEQKTEKIEMPITRKEETTVTTSFTKSSVATRPEAIPKKPMLLAEPVQHIFVKAGEKLVLESRVDSVPASTFRWYVNNFEVKPGQFVIFEQVSENHSRATFLRPATGNYKIVASNELGSVSTVTRVTSEVVEEEIEERTTVTTTATDKPAMFKLTKKSPVAGRRDFPKAPRIIERLPASVTVKEGEILFLTVVADSVPEAEFTWRINNFEVKQNSNTIIERLEKNVSRATFKEAVHGKYDVIAKNNMGQDISSGKVIVEYKETESHKVRPVPIFLQSLPLETTTSTTTEETRLAVSVSGIPPFDFRWFVGGEEVENTVTSETVVEGNKAILILRRPVEEGTVVTVEARNKGGVVRSQTTIRKTVEQVLEIKHEETTTHSQVQLVNRAPVFVRRLDDMEVDEGSKFSCTVEIDRNSAPCTFEWRYPSKIHVEATSHESTATIEKATTSANLSVLAKNQFGSATTAAHIDVLSSQDEAFEMVPPDLPEESAPKIIEPLHSASFLDGQPMVLRCRIEANPSAAIIWSKDDINVEEWVINKDVTTQILPGGICELLNPECYPEDSGLYKCAAANPHGTAETSAYINVEGISYKKDGEEASMSESVSATADEWILEGEKIILPPKFTENLTAEIDAVFTLHYIRLVCKVHSSAPTTIHWTRDNVVISASDKYEIYEFDDGTQILTVHDASQLDDGVYTCQVESEHGLSSSSCQVEVPVIIQSNEEHRSHVEIEVDHPEAPKEAEPQSEVVQTPSESTTETIVQVVHKPPKLDKKENYSETTEIKKNEEQFKLLVMVAESTASTLVANVFMDAVKEAVKKIIEESEEEEDFFDTSSEFAPRFETSMEEYTVKEKDAIRMSTTVVGHPIPFVEWYFGEQKIKVSESISMSYEKGVASLNLKSAQLNQEGNYYCHATNTHGTSVLSMKLTVIRESITKESQVIHAGLEEIATSVSATSAETRSENFVTVEETQQEEKIIDLQAVPTVEKLILPPEKIEEPRVQKLASPPPKVEQTTRTVAEKFAETLTKSVIMQAQDIVLTSLPKEPIKGETHLTNTVKTVVLDKEEDSGRRSITMLYEEKLKVIEDRLNAVANLRVSPQEAVNLVMNTVMSLKEQHMNDETANVDVRRPHSQFDNLVTVVEPEMIQLGLHLIASSAPSLKFIDLETIMQKPSTSADADTLLSHRSRRNASAEHRIVLLEGISQSFHNAMTWSLKRVQRLATDEAASATTNVEVMKAGESGQQSMTVLESHRVAPDLLQIAASASKLKIENVTVSLVRHGDSAHEQLIIEYESQVDDDAGLNLSHLVYQAKDDTESKSEVWTRRSKYSDNEDLNVVAVFVEVDANCPDQSVEIVASVNMPLAPAIPAGATSPQQEISEIEESSSATGLLPKFVRRLVDCQTVVGNTVQFKCIVSGSPMPTVIWSVDGDVIQSNQEYDIVYEDGVCILRILEALIEDEGEYTCEASNQSGKAITKCYLKVNHKINSSDRPTLFFEHVPSITDQYDGRENSIDSFEFQEKMANLLHQEDNPESESSVVTSNSEFDVRRIINYNADLAESNAFHKYFETAETVVRVLEFSQIYRMRISLSACPNILLESVQSTSHTDIFFAKSREDVEHTMQVIGPHSQSSSQSMEANFIASVNSDAFNRDFEDPFQDAQPIVYQENRLYEPRIPLLPQKFSFKGQEIGVSVNEIEKEISETNDNGELERSMKKFLETSLEFHSDIDTKNIKGTKRQEIDHQTRLQRMKEQRKDSFEKAIAGLSDVEADLQRQQSKDEQTGPLEMTSPISTNIEPESQPSSPEKQPMTLDELVILTERLHRDSSGSASPRKSPEKTSSLSPRKVDLVKKNDQIMAEKMKEIQKIAKKVEQELSSISSFSNYNTASEAENSSIKEIEDAIYSISEQLMLQNPVTEAHAEASEELLRTTLAGMILNPAKTEEEEIELMKEPIRLLRRKLSDIENSLMEDVEVEDITQHETLDPDNEKKSDDKTRITPQVVVTPGMKTSIKRKPSMEYMRMTPLTSNIKDQLTCLEEMINEHVSTSPAADGTTEEQIEVKKKKRKELHDLFVEINNEINTIRAYCSKKLSKAGSDAVMAVLVKVRTHVTSIVNVIALAKKKPVGKMESTDTDTEKTVRYHMKKYEPKEHIVVEMVYRKQKNEEAPMQSSVAVSTSDDTWRYSAELKTSSIYTAQKSITLTDQSNRVSKASTDETTSDIFKDEGLLEPNISEAALQLSVELAQSKSTAVTEPAPIPKPRSVHKTKSLPPHATSPSSPPPIDSPPPVPPPRRRRTASADPSSKEETPVPPPRTKRDQRRRNLSLDSRRQESPKKEFVQPNRVADELSDNAVVHKPWRTFTEEFSDLLKSIGLFKKDKKMKKTETYSNVRPDEPTRAKSATLPTASSSWHYEAIPPSPIIDQEQQSLIEPVNEAQQTPVQLSEYEHSNVIADEHTKEPTNQTVSKREKEENILIEKEVNAQISLKKKAESESVISSELKIPAEVNSHMEFAKSSADEGTSVHLDRPSDPLSKVLEYQDYSMDSPVDRPIEDYLNRSSDEASLSEEQLLQELLKSTSSDTNRQLAAIQSSETSEVNASEVSYTSSETSVGAVLSHQGGIAEEAETEVAVISRSSTVCHILDDASSIQMFCEESDYGTDTDTSCLLRGTVKFFKTDRPKSVISQASSKLQANIPEADENVENVDVDIEIASRGSRETTSEVEFNVGDDFVVYEDDRLSQGSITSEQIGSRRGSAPMPTIMERSTEGTEKNRKFDSDDTIHMVMEETLLSQMESSIKSQNESRTLEPIRETDILSDNSLLTEHETIVDHLEESFEFVRASARKRLLALVSPEMKMVATATVALDNSFDVEIEQEPQQFGLSIRVIEDQVDFTSLTIAADSMTAENEMPIGFHEDLTETSSFDEYDEMHEPKAGITVSIIARSLHDGIYASLEEIPWGEAHISLQATDSLMARSMDDESKMNSMFNVTVSESNAAEKKSLKSQASFKSSQNSISEMETTLSSGSINIPSYVIKLGSTATITCELNNYLPEKSLIEWYKGKNQLAKLPGKFDRISHDLLEVLIINNVELEDNELYSLKVNDEIFPVAYLIVEEMSTEMDAIILTPPQTQFVMEGQPTALMVQINDPSRTVYWLKEKKPLKESKRLLFETTDNGTNRIVIFETHLQDQGTYSAVLGEQTVNITLVVEERIDEKEVTVVASDADVEEDVQEYLVPPGSTATIACELEACDTERPLVWLKNGKPMSFDNVDKQEHVINGLKHYLVIHDTDTSDSGLYSVSISNTEFRVAHLAVTDFATNSHGLRRKRISNNSLQ